MSVEDYRKYLDQKIAAMRQRRSSYLVHWRELADYILPRRYRWLVVANQSNRGSPINGNIIDSTGTLASRVLASGMMAGITSPTRPWFKLKIEGYETDEVVGRWLVDCERRLMRVFQESNFYQSMAVLYYDLVVFGTASNIIYEDFDNVIHCCNSCLGEFFFEVDSRFEVRTVAREFTMTAEQMIEMFGEQNVSEQIRSARSDGARQLHESVVYHIIEPNRGFSGIVAERFPFREAYWDASAPNDRLLASRGYFEWPCMTPRWDVVGNDPYGRSPGMDALGDIKQLQQETKRKAQAIDKMVTPPMLADVSLKNNPASLLPGGITYVSGLGNGREGMKPIYQVMPPIADMKQDIQEVQQRVKITFHNDLFTGITDLQTVRTATEIDARREEKLVLLGPVLERIMGEGLGQAIDRVWGIMWRGRLLPPPPEALAGRTAHIQVDYVSMLALAQRGLATAAIEKLWGFAGNIAAVRPSILDGLNEDASLEEYAEALGVSPKLLRTEEEIAAMREAAQAQAQAAQAAELASVGAQGAKTLSETEVGGGANALELILGGAA